jgi:hypothetical protein
VPSSLLQKRHGNTAEVTFILIDALVTMASLPTPSLLLDAINATLEDSSFKTGSEVATRAFEAAETLKGWCRDKSNEVPYTEFSEQLLKELKGALPAVATINRERIWRSFFSLRSSSAFNSRSLPNDQKACASVFIQTLLVKNHSLY